jgi:hypothetical protein
LRWRGRGRADVLEEIQPSAQLAHGKVHVRVSVQIHEEGNGPPERRIAADVDPVERIRTGRERRHGGRAGVHEARERTVDAPDEQVGVAVAV